VSVWRVRGFGSASVRVFESGGEDLVNTAVIAMYVAVLRAKDRARA